jgi:hypothetical protein
MKKTVSMLFLLIIAGTMSAQGPKGPMGKSENGQPLAAQRKYQIIVENERNAKKVQDTNDRLLALQESSRGEAQRGLFGDLLWQGFSSAFKQKTVNATSNLASLGLNYIQDALKSDREKWYCRAQQQCYYKQPLSAETRIDDFYALPSTKGAMDPENLKFEGFGCKNYIEVIGGSNEGVGVFYIFCKMRRDSVGLRHIINHSKFMVEIDSLIINPKYCNLPNDSTGSPDSRFDFEKRDNLNLELKVRFYSSWMNQATMIASDQQIGEFTVIVKVDKRKLNSQGLFVYDKNDSEFENLISIDGDCYIVPRSYTGTSDAVSFQPTWGTGQYRIEMEVSERCTIVDSYYKIRESGKGEIVAAVDATPDGDRRNAEKWKWDKAKWKVEWNAMNARRKGDSFFNNAWKCIVSAYKGTGWMATLTDPLTTALYSWETQKLGNWIDDMHEKLFEQAKGSSSAMPSMSDVSNPSSSSSPNRNPMPNGGQSGKPMGGGTPQ